MQPAHQPSAARLHVLLRPESDVALVIRQGPSQLFCTIGWDLTRDDLRVGQWCKHKLYPERCDISPDGKWLIYFALNGRWNSETLGAWTALSRVPYLKAVKIWPQGNTWGGGGSMYSIEQEPSAVRPEPPLPPNVHLLFGRGRRDRIVRDGWRKTDGGKGRFHKQWSDDWTLSKKQRGNTYHEEHQLLGKDQQIIDLPDWEWAEVDAARDRLVWAEKGAIYATQDKVNPLAGARLIFDTNPMRFEPLAAPYDDDTIFVRPA